MKMVTLIAIKVDNPEEIIYFPSVLAAAGALETERRSIQHCIQGSDRYSNVKGYILRELDENGDIIETETGFHCGTAFADAYGRTN